MVKSCVLAGRRRTPLNPQIGASAAEYSAIFVSHFALGGMPYAPYTVILRPGVRSSALPSDPGSFSNSYSWSVESRLYAFIPAIPNPLSGLHIGPVASHWCASSGLSEEGYNFPARKPVYTQINIRTTSYLIIFVHTCIDAVTSLLHDHTVAVILLSV